MGSSFRSFMYIKYKLFVFKLYDNDIFTLYIINDAIYSIEK